MTFYVDPQGIVRPKLGPKMSTKAPNIPPDMANPRGKVDDIMRDRMPPKSSSPEASRWRHVGRGTSQFLGQKVSVPKLVGRSMLPLALTQSASSEVAPESKLLPNAGEVFRINDERAGKAYEEGGVIPALKETASAFFPLLGGITQDVIDYGASFFDKDEKKPYIAPPSTGQQTAATVAGANAGPAGTTATQAVATPPAAPEPNPLVRINRPGQSPEYTNVPEQPGYDTGTPIAMPDFSAAREAAQVQGVQGQGPAPYQSPVAQFMEKNPIPTVDPRRATFGDLMANNVRLNNYRSQLLPSVALQKQMGEQRRRGETDREFELKLHKFDQEGEIAQQNALAELAKMRERSRESALNRAVTVRGQDLRAQGGGSTYADQLKEMDAIGELSARYFPDAPPGFASMVPNLAAYGVGLDQIRDTYNQVTAEQMATQRVKSPAELDAQMLLNVVAARLGIAQ